MGWGSDHHPQGAGQGTGSAEQGQDIYAQRKQKTELPFGHLKHNLQANEFLLKGKSGTNAELSLLSTAFNVTRMISIIGVAKLLTQLPLL